MDMQSKGEVEREASRPATPDSHVQPSENPKTPKKQIRQTLNNPNLGPYNTPIARNESSCKDGLQKQNAKIRYPRYAKELLEWCYGPMPPQDFIDTFLPRIKRLGDQSMPAAKHAFEGVPKSPTNEKEIYLALVGLAELARGFLSEMCLERCIQCS